MYPSYDNNSREGFLFLSYCLQPKSRGSISLRSNNIRHHPKIDPAYLQHYDDVLCTYGGTQIFFIATHHLSLPLVYFFFHRTLHDESEFSSDKLRSSDARDAQVSWVWRERSSSRFRRVSTFATRLPGYRIHGMRAESRCSHQLSRVWLLQDGHRWSCSRRWEITVRKLSFVLERTKFVIFYFYNVRYFLSESRVQKVVISLFAFLQYIWDNSFKQIWNIVLNIQEGGW